MINIRPLHNKIFFKFEEDIVKSVTGRRTFRESNDSIVMLGNDDDSSKKPRWATVYAVGPTVDSDIVVGSKICIEALRWTESFTVDDVELWQTNDKEVILIDN